jgi:DNA-directed RNA polymerase subunit H (RpoH/RPB5)
MWDHLVSMIWIPTLETSGNAGLVWDGMGDILEIMISSPTLGWIAYYTI